MVKRPSVARKSKANRARKSAGGEQWKSMKRTSSAGGKRKSAVGGSHKKAAGGEKQIGIKNARRGRDKFTYSNGDKYEGDWLAIYPDIFVRDGEGTYECSDGTIYHGLWELDLLANGSIVWPCGQKYSGDFSFGKMNGMGTYTLPGRGELSGHFVDNKPVGNVIFLDNAGMKYIGRVAPDAQTVRLKMLNHLAGEFTSEELVLPEPPKGMDDNDLARVNEKGSGLKSGRKSRASRSSRASKAGKKRQSKSKSTGGGKRQSMKRKSSVKRNK